MESKTVKPDIILDHDNNVSQRESQRNMFSNQTDKAGTAEELALGAGASNKQNHSVTDIENKTNSPSGSRDSEMEIAIKQEPMEETPTNREEDSTTDDNHQKKQTEDSACKGDTVSAHREQASAFKSHGPLRIKLKNISKPSMPIKVEPLDLSAGSASPNSGTNNCAADSEGVNDEENIADEEMTLDETSDCNDNVDDDDDDDDDDDNEMELLPIYFQSDSSTLHPNKNLQATKVHLEEGEKQENVYDRNSKRSSGSKAKNNHTCYICHKQYSEEIKLLLHMRNHTSAANLPKYVEKLASRVVAENEAGEKGPLHCEHCPSVTFKNRAEFQKHLKKHLSKDPVKCPYCEEICASELQLSGHMKVHFGMQGRNSLHSDKQSVKRTFPKQMGLTSPGQPVSVEQGNDISKDGFECKLCLLTFGSPEELANHGDIHSEKIKAQAAAKTRNRRKKTAAEKEKKNQPRKCPHCGSEFKNAKNLRSHVRVHSTVKPFKCEECTAAFVRSSDLSRHKKTHTGEKAYKCQLCDSAFADSSKLKIHMRIHTGERPYKCELCGEAFSQASQYARHMRVHNGEKPFQCQYCPSAFTMTSDYRRHLKIHTGERPFMCEYCPASFPEAKNLRIHVRTHTGEKPYKCEFCHSAFAQTANLKRHIKTHTGERPAKCELCPSAFADKHKLRVHMRSHSGEKPYHCQICPSAFATSSALNRHLIMHSGDKPFKCEHCPATFAHMAKQRVHTMCHTFNGPFKCQHCTASFRNAYGLTVHSHLHE